MKDRNTTERILSFSPDDRFDAVFWFYEDDDDRPVAIPVVGFSIIEATNDLRGTKSHSIEPVYFDREMSCICPCHDAMNFGGIVTRGSPPFTAVGYLGVEESRRAKLWLIENARNGSITPPEWFDSWIRS